MIILRRKRRLATKVNISFFVGNDVLNIFYVIIFLKKTIFLKWSQKTIFEGHDHFLRIVKLYKRFLKIVFFDFPTLKHCSSASFTVESWERSHSIGNSLLSSNHPGLNSKLTKCPLFSCRHSYITDIISCSTFYTINGYQKLWS